MDKETEQMKQSMEFLALKNRVNRFLDCVRPMVDKPYHGQMVRISNSTALLIDNLEELMKKAELRSWATEQLRIETWIVHGVINILNTNRKVKAKLVEVRAVYRGEQTQRSEVDESRIERETESELKKLWCEIMWEQRALLC
jgi:hypothetical protein